MHVGDDTPVEVLSSPVDTSSVELRLGDGPDGVVLVGAVADLQRLVIEADRQVSLFASRGPVPPLPYDGPAGDDP